MRQSKLFFILIIMMAVLGCQKTGGVGTSSMDTGVDVATGTDSEMVDSDTGTGSAMVGSDTGTGSELVDSDTGTGSAMVDSDTGTDSAMVGSDTGIDSEMVDSDTGTGSEPEKGDGDTVLDSDSNGSSDTVDETEFDTLTTLDSELADSDTDTSTDTDLVDGDTEEGAAMGTIWISIAGGTFEMGSTYSSNEQPIHTVSVPSFEMLKTEVTAAQYEACVTAGNCAVPAPWQNDAGFATYGYTGRENNPVNYVNWQQAVDFCTWIGGRLPSEAEWEYAARSGGQEYIYPWGDETATCTYAVMNSDSAGCGTDNSMAVCSKTAGNTDQGLCDMAGNVGEWVQDWYHSDYTGAPIDGSARDDSGTFPFDDLPLRVLRGGSLALFADRQRVASRYYYNQSDTHYLFGFRCAR